MKFQINMLSSCALALAMLAGAAHAQTRPALIESPVSQPKTIMYVGLSLIHI